MDSSLFHVKPARGGRWDFEFFTSVVEPHGAMNLHRHRVKWWQEALQKQSNEATHTLGASLTDLKFPTDRQAALPECYSRYFQDIKIDFPDATKNPDEVFFKKKVLPQVQGRTYWRTWKDGFLDQHSLAGIPVFYCGGGTRMPFYQRLHGELQSMRNYSWLCAIPRRIEIPRNLEAPGLHREEFDRLSVAYGLSFLEVGKIIRSIPEPKLVFRPESSWQETYIGKDQC